jgi:hypothetical protein
MMVKKDLYMAKGAREFWLCNEDGVLNFLRGGCKKLQ